MLRSVLALIVAFTLLMQTAITRAQDSARTTDDWSAIERLPNEERLEVELKNGRRVRGRLVSASPTGVAIINGGKTTTLSRDEVQRIYRLMGKTRGQSALRGALIGGAIGVGSGLALYLPNREDIIGWVVPAFGVIGTGVGAGLGAALGRGRARVLVYQA